jgi:hypothetical protein
MSMSKVASRGNPKLGGVPISTLGAELSKAMSGIGLRAHKRAKSKGFRGNAGEDIKRMSRNGIGKVRDDGDAVPSIRSLIRGHVSRWGGVRKSRGRIRT